MKMLNLKIAKFRKSFSISLTIQLTNKSFQLSNLQRITELKVQFNLKNFGSKAFSFNH